ncbi:hypothetical protein AN477_07410 [Alicyclobacillus ferrooxydans]|uniref:Uncharacterized protein n=1 Tax=Alicyclobacillus ferrooxydans TaxID=471514 RepID=A0A0P9CFT5_9BACL|nr:hypothetical protein AN477_07410 [Alicyclobacillus ferrooxydans]
MDLKADPLIINIKLFLQRFDNPVADKAKGSYIVREHTKFKLHSAYLHKFRFRDKDTHYLNPSTRELPVSRSKKSVSVRYIKPREVVIRIAALTTVFLSPQWNPSVSVTCQWHNTQALHPLNCSAQICDAEKSAVLKSAVLKA